MQRVQLNSNKMTQFEWAS